MERNCRDCEWYELKKRPGDGPFAGKKPWCNGLGFFLMGNHAPDCKLYRPRPGFTSKPLGGEL